MVVIGIISILATIVTVMSSGVIRSARQKRRDTMQRVLQEGIATFRARNGRWPGALESHAVNGTDHTFSGSEADAAFQEVVKGSVSRSSAPYLNPSALFVAPAGEANGGGGLNFDEAIKKNPPRHYRHLNVSQMAFGYPNPSNGKFRRFRIVYNAAADYATVTYPDDEGSDNY